MSVTHSLPICFDRDKTERANFAMYLTQMTQPPSHAHQPEWQHTVNQDGAVRFGVLSRDERDDCCLARPRRSHDGAATSAQEHARHILHDGAGGNDGMSMSTHV